MVNINITMTQVGRLCPFCVVYYDDHDAEYCCKRLSVCGDTCAPTGDCVEYFGRSKVECSKPGTDVDTQAFISWLETEIAECVNQVKKLDSDPMQYSEFGSVIISKRRAELTSKWSHYIEILKKLKGE